MGLKDVDSLIKDLDPDDTGEIEYSKAIAAIQVKPGNACDFKSGRVHVEVVPHSERPRHLTGTIVMASSEKLPTALFHGPVQILITKKIVKSQKWLKVNC